VRKPSERKPGIEPAEPDPGPGWLRSKVRGLPWPRPGHEMPCGRHDCPVCREAKEAKGKKGEAK
jgi:hypothetical protein